MDDQAPITTEEPLADAAPDMTPMPLEAEPDHTPAEIPGSGLAEVDADEEDLPELPERTGPDTEEADVRDLPIGEIAEIANIRPTYYGVEELAESLRVQGQLEPCMVRPAPPGATHGKPWELVFGFRRKRAAELLRWDLLRCQVRPISDSEVLEVMLTENLQREDLSAIAAAKTMRALIDLGGLRQADVARRLGVHPSHVSHSLKLLSLAPPVIERIDKGEISASHGEALAALPEAQQEAFAEKVAKESVSVAKLTSWVRQAKEEEALPPPELPGALEPVTADDVTDLPRLYLREQLTAAEQLRGVCYALLRNGNDQEILDWLEEREGVPYERLWSWLRDLEEEELTELERRLVRRYLESAHRFPSFEPELVSDLGDQDALEGAREGVLTPAIEPTLTPDLALPAAPAAPDPAEEDGSHWADDLDEPADLEDEPLELEDEEMPPADDGGPQDAEIHDEGPENEDPEQPGAFSMEDALAATAEDAFEHLLAESFVRLQGMDEEGARRIADKLAVADPDIQDAALAWATDGQLPDTPVIEGASPESLGRRLGKPSMVFTAMIRLREDPVAAKAALIAAAGGAGAESPAARLAEAFIERQEMDPEKARALAAKIFAGDQDIRDAALEWADSGQMGDQPVIEEETPASLAARLPKPSLVFTALTALRTNPAEARLRIPPRT